MSSKFRLHPLTARFVLTTHAARPPFHLVLAIPKSATREGLPLFSPFHAINQLLGPFKTANKLLDAKIWAPTLNPKLFARFVGLPYPYKQWPSPDIETESLRATEFLEPADDFVRPGDAPAHWPIVHFVGRVNDAPNGEPILQSEFFGDSGSYAPGALRDALVACGSRLFILQCLTFDLTRANQLAEWIAGGGGPAVLVVAIDDQDATQSYFLELLAGLVHNLPLTVAAEIPSQLLRTDMEVDLYFGLEAENSLQLDRWIAHLRETLAREQKETLSVVNIMKKWNDSQARYLHPDQIARREKHHNLKLRKYEGALKELSDLQVQLESLPPQPWHRETERALLVADATNQHDSLSLRFESLRDAWQPAGLYEEDRRETETTNERLARGGTRVLLGAPKDVRVPFPHDFREWVLLTDEETERAPRVLNATFRQVKDETVVEPERAMQPGSEYDLLVDIGPRWNRLKSLVRGQSGFPNTR